MSTERMRDKPYSAWTDTEKMARAIFTTCSVELQLGKVEVAEQFVADKLTDAERAVHERWLAAVETVRKIIGKGHFEELNTAAWAACAAILAEVDRGG